MACFCLLYNIFTFVDFRADVDITGFPIFVVNVVYF